MIRNPERVIAESKSDEKATVPDNPFVMAATLAFASLHERTSTPANSRSFASNLLTTHNHKNTL
jgi:hypothetical protein